ncbi:MAG TPA: hypothetical protein VNG29_03445 [Candidatus Paceibacterota bacterium]|nr:hypothetical protein [Candidatus Paceibacterota bacterium]
MTPQLAKQLKDAGFPQNGAKGKSDYAPTLSDLITACDKAFFSLRHTPDDHWLATGRFAAKENQIPYYESAPYDEPEAAVAELFLAMRLHGNKK